MITATCGLCRQTFTVDGWGYGGDGMHLAIELYMPPRPGQRPHTQALHVICGVVEGRSNRDVRAQGSGLRIDAEREAARNRKPWGQGGPQERHRPPVDKRGSEGGGAQGWADQQRRKGEADALAGIAHLFISGKLSLPCTSCLRGFIYFTTKTQFRGHPALSGSCGVCRCQHYLPIE